MVNLEIIANKFMIKKYYETLGLPLDSTQTEIKNAFKKKALLLHPDKTKQCPETTEKFLKITEAYNFLKEYPKIQKTPSSKTKKEKVKKLSVTQILLESNIKTFFYSPNHKKEIKTIELQQEEFLKGTTKIICLSRDYGFVERFYFQIKIPPWKKGDKRKFNLNLELEPNDNFNIQNKKDYLFLKKIELVLKRK